MNQKSTLEEKLDLQRRIFHVGEEVSVKGSRFKVQRITPKRLILKLLPWEFNQQMHSTGESTGE